MKTRDQSKPTLEQELNTFRQAVAHVTEDGKTRRSFSTPGSWAMVHADRLTDLEITEERLAAVEKQRDELLAALKRTLPAINDVHDLDEAKAAIANVKGGS